MILTAPGRILAIDYGKKRIGLAVTDPLQMIATRLATVSSADIWKFLEGFLQRENITLVIIGYPLQMNNTPSEAVQYINPFMEKFNKKYPGIPVEKVDERFTSKLARRAMIDGGLKKRDRQDKALVDGVSATIILQSFLERQRYKS